LKRYFDVARFSIYKITPCKALTKYPLIKFTLGFVTLFIIQAEWKIRGTNAKNVLYEVFTF